MRERGVIRLGVCGALVLLLLAAAGGCDRPTGPAPVAWDRTRCAHCGMLVSDPAWAAQRVDPERGVSFYDDPGCLLVSLEAGEIDDASAGALYFHHHEDDVWLAREEVAFVPAGPSPMGYGLGAVARGESDEAIPLGTAREHALAVDRERAAATRRARAGAGERERAGADEADRAGADEPERRAP
jgi:hypothetical protein